MRLLALLPLILAACAAPTGPTGTAPDPQVSEAAQDTATSYPSGGAVDRDWFRDQEDAEANPDLTAPAEETAIASRTDPTRSPASDAPLYRRWVTEDGRIEYELDPYAAEQVKRADHQVYVTLLAQDVALVVEPSDTAPIWVSNKLAAALVRRFAGSLDTKEALGAARVFFVQPKPSEESVKFNGVLVVDWTIRDERRGPVGAVYATRRLSGAVNGKDPWTAMTYEDAEHIALQTAAHIIEAPGVRAAIQSAREVSRLEATPTPAPRPGG